MSVFAAELLLYQYVEYNSRTIVVFCLFLLLLFCLLLFTVVLYLSAYCLFIVMVVLISKKKKSFKTATQIRSENMINRRLQYLHLGEEIKLFSVSTLQFVVVCQKLSLTESSN